MDQLRLEFGRPVVYIYDNGHTLQAVEDEPSFQDCVQYAKSKFGNPASSSGQPRSLEAYIIDEEEVSRQSRKIRIKQPDLKDSVSPVTHTLTFQKGGSDSGQKGGSDSGQPGLKIRHSRAAALEAYRRAQGRSCQYFH